MKILLYVNVEIYVLSQSHCSPEDMRSEVTIKFIEDAPEFAEFMRVMGEVILTNRRQRRPKAALAG